MDEVVNEIKGMIADDCKLDDASRRYGVSRTTIKRFCHDHGIRWPKGPHRDVDLRLAVMSCVQRGVETAPQIAAIVRVDRAWVLRLIRELEKSGAVRRTGWGRWMRTRPTREWQLQKQRAGGDERTRVEVEDSSDD